MIATLLFIVLVLAVGSLVYSHALYPIVLSLVPSRWTADETESRPEFRPSVSMIVPAYNEADCIGRKMANVSSLRFDGEFECIVVSDSQDDTDSIVRGEGDDSVELLSFDDRMGKSRAINEGIKRATGDIIVLSDANTMYDRDALSQLVEPLSHPEIGCVTGHLQLRDQDGTTSESAYWRYELRMRELEAKFGTTVSVNGGMVAFAKDDFPGIPEHVVNDDMYLALSFHSEEDRVHFTRDAIGWEYTTGDLLSEFHRRVRIGFGNYQLVSEFLHLLSPRYGVVSAQLFSHKLLRWFGPFLLITIGASALGLAVLGSAVGKVLTAITLIVLVFAGIGVSNESARQLAPIRLTSFYLLMNLALLFGFVKFVVGNRTQLWQSTR